MRLALLFVSAIALLFSVPVADAKGRGYSSPYSPSSTAPHGKHGPSKAEGVQRDERGRIARSAKAKDEFKRTNPCPSTGKGYGACPGYVIDHVTPLKRGGSDSPTNMQWQTVGAAREKDKWE